MSEKYKKVYKNGITYHMSETGACRDIDVEDWVEEVSFGDDVTKIWLRKNSKKRFENPYRKECLFYRNAKYCISKCP